MREYYCLDVSFPEIEFDIYISNSEPSDKIHHAHLYTEENEIELRILFDPKTYFGDKLMYWASKLNWRTFGSFIKTSNENQNDGLLKIDFSNSALLRILNGSKQKEGNFQYISIKVNSVIFYRNPLGYNVNTAEFYLDDAGFKVVKEFYAPLWGSDEEFKISRMKGMEEFYSIGKGEFRPEFNFCYSDKKDSKEARIIKEPKIQFHYKEDITIEEAIKYADLIRLLTSFYFHSQVNYTLSKIRLKENTIIIKEIEKKSITSSSGGLMSFNIGWSFHKLLKSNWQLPALNNHKKLTKVIEMFNQALSVEGSTEFLIRFNIIEICMGGTKNSDEEFALCLDESEKKKRFDGALELLLQAIDPKDHADFKAKWHAVSSQLKYKSMKRLLHTFLEKQNLAPSEFPISVKTIMELRNNIIHGSIDKVNPELLEKTNTLLYRINGILILNLFGITEWSLNKELN